jgi:tetratricopeptide (TPR) repeat protein
LFHEEAIFYYCYLRFYLSNDKKGVADFIEQQQLDVVNNNLYTYLAANLSINSQQAAKAIEVLNARNRSDVYMASPVWDLEMGYAKLHHLEPDAVVYFENFLKQFKGKFYVKDVLLKLGWHYYLQGDEVKAAYYRKEIAKRGSAETDADKLAQKEGKYTQWPNRLLLQARMLNDGGYHREALRLLHGKTTADFVRTEEKLEFAYRVGRLYDDLNVDDQAMTGYKEAIAIGENRKEYFAARAALHIGFIYEERGDKATAISWFEKCISMEDHDYKNSLDQRAKAGISRCKE